MIVLCRRVKVSKMETNVALVLLVGIPGAGKSTVCKKLAFYLKSRCVKKALCILHVCYDDIIPLSDQRNFVKLKQNDDHNYSENETWKNARHNVFSKVDELIKCLKTRSENASLHNFFNLSNVIVESDASYIVLLDDNFYYRSMRYEFYQLARKHTIGFCQLFIECTIDVAIQQNLQRETPVPTGVIETMAAKLQPPLPREHSWESTTCVLKSDNLEELHVVWDMIKHSFQSPVVPLENHELEKAEARLKCSSSVVHQADIYLRSLVGQLIKEARLQGNMGPREVSDFSRNVLAGRQSVLAAVRNGVMHFPPELAEAVNDGNREEFQSILECELRNILPQK